MRQSVVYLLVFLALFGGVANAANVIPGKFSVPERNAEGCFAVGQYDDGFWVGLGQSIDDKPFILMGHKKWTSLTEGRGYQTIISVPDHFQTTLSGAAKSAREIMYPKPGGEVLDAFSKGSIFYVAFGGMFAGPYDLKGSAGAIKEVSECVKEMALAQTARAVNDAGNSANDVELPVRTKLDTRQCRADTAVFQDSSFGTTFKVQKVARKGVYQCNGQTVQEPTGSGCRFFGDTILSGAITPRDLLNSGDPNSEPASIVSSVIDGSPCCSQALFKGSVDQLLSKPDLFSSNSTTFKWFDAKDMPTLGDLEIDSLEINLMETTAAPSSSFYPVSCQADVLFALPEICEKASKGANDWSKEGDDGIWWVKGTRIGGHEYDCEILSFTRGIADVYCDMGDFGRWTDKVHLNVTDTEMRVGEGKSLRTLKRCDL